MQIFIYVAFLIALGIAIFSVQNSDAPRVIIRFLVWRFETSLVYTILGSICLGIFLTLLLWIPRAIKNSLKKRIPRENLSIEEPH